MKNFLLILIKISLLTQICLAEEKVVYLKKAQPSPYEGFLFTPDKTKELRYKMELLDFEKTKNIHLTQINKLQKSAIQEQGEEINQLKSKDTTLIKIGMFLLGVATTTLLVVGIQKTVH